MEQKDAETVQWLPLFAFKSWTVRANKPNLRMLGIRVRFIEHEPSLGLRWPRISKHFEKLTGCLYMPMIEGPNSDILGWNFLSIT